jgi:hypothetical protein
MYYVETMMDCVEFATYREAEIYCGEMGIPCECIFEE